MSKKILVLTGSARKGGNSNRMAKAFADAAASKGHDVKVIDKTDGIAQAEALAEIF